MNEVSQGTAGNMEYVEFVVVDNSVPYNCNSSTPPTIDIRGWIFDDNSGYHGIGGIAEGAIRFSYSSIWSAVPLGTIILIYNDAFPDPSIPIADLSLNDGNCRIIAPISNTILFESNNTTPGAVACSYPTTGWTPGGTWSNTFLRNEGDCARIVNLAGCEVFSVCYGDVNLNTQIYFANGAELPNDHRNTVYYFNGIDPLQQVNWSIGCTDNETTLDANQCGANFQTPGAPNNAVNAAFIGQFNNNCLPIVPMVASNTVNNITCNGVSNGSAIITASGGIAGYQISWTGPSSGNPSGIEITASGGSYNMTGLSAGTYNVTVTGVHGCTANTSFTITQPAAMAASNTSTNVSCNGGNNGAVAITVNGGTAGYNVSWTGTTISNPAGIEITASGGTYNIVGLTAGTYNITVTDANGCIATTVVTISEPAPLNLSLVGTSPQSCICNGSASISASGATGSYTYAWFNSNNNNINQPTSTASNLCSGSYYCIVTTSNGCSETISVFVPTTCSSYGTFASATMVENCDTLQFYNSTWGTLPDQINPLGILLNGYDYGPFFQNSGTLILRGGEVKTYKDPGANVCGAKLHYAVYSATNPPANPIFTILDLPFKESCNVGTSSFPTGGPCFYPGDQKWAKENYNIDLTNNLPGDYILEVFYAVPGSFTSSNGCSDTIYVNNNGLNYKAIFRIEPLPVITPNGPTTFCEGGAVTLTSNYFIGNQWNNGSDLNVIDASTAGTFTTNIDLGNNCPLASDSEIISVLTLPELIDLSGGGEFCEGDVIEPIVASVSGSPDWILIYNFNGGANQIINSSNANITLGSSEGVYVLSNISDANCSNLLNDTIEIVVNTIPNMPNIDGGGEFCLGSDVPPLSVTGSNGFYNWFSDAGLTQNIGTGSSIIPDQVIGNATYWVTETVSGCVSPANSVAIAFLACEITVPTAFTPDGDLKNDYWNIQDIDSYYPENQVFVYNRWGALLYQSEKGAYSNNPWNGKYKDENLPVGSYYFIIETGEESLKGIVSILLD